MKILIVEDQRRLGQFLKRSLTERSYTATWVQTCREARDALCETSYDAIILDLGLPDGDGLDLLKEWRKGGFQEPVLILSARDAVADRIKGLDSSGKKGVGSGLCWISPTATIASLSVPVCRCSSFQEKSSDLSRTG